MSESAPAPVTIDLAGIGERLTEILANPGANLTAAFFLLALVGIVGLMIVVAVALRILSVHDKQRAAAAASGVPSPEAVALGMDPEDGGRPESAVGSAPTALGPAGVRRRGALLAVAAGTLLLLSLYLVVVYSASPRICWASCHADVVAHVADGEVSAQHAGAECVACHEGAANTRLTYLAPRLAHVVGHSAGIDYAYPPAGSRGCLACHDTIDEGVVISSDLPIRMSHAQPTAAGLACMDCHAVSHDEEATALSGRMNTCLVCHDGRTAASECETCHTGDPGNFRRASGTGRVLGRVGATGRVECGGCHDQTSCDACHGLRMPHSEEFEQGGHAMPAAFERKESCFLQCHEPADCGECHGSFESHGPNFKATHGEGLSYSSPCSCHAPAEDPQRPFCPICHTSE